MQNDSQGSVSWTLVRLYRSRSRRLLLILTHTRSKRTMDRRHSDQPVRTLKEAPKLGRVARVVRPILVSSNSVGNVENIVPTKRSRANHAVNTDAHRRRYAPWWSPVTLVR